MLLQEENKAVGEIELLLFSTARVCVNQCGDRLILAKDVQNMFAHRYHVDKYKHLLPKELQEQLTLTIKIKDGFAAGEYYPATLLTDICFELAYGNNPLCREEQYKPLVKMAGILMRG